MILPTRVLIGPRETRGKGTPVAIGRARCRSEGRRGDAGGGASAVTGLQRAARTE